MEATRSVRVRFYVAVFDRVDDDALAKQIYFVANAEGTALAPFDCWLLLMTDELRPSATRPRQLATAVVAGFLACCCWIAPARCTACRQQTEHSPSQPRGRAPREEPAAAALPLPLRLSPPPTRCWVGLIVRSAASTARGTGQMRRWPVRWRQNTATRGRLALVKIVSLCKTLFTMP